MAQHDVYGKQIMKQAAGAAFEEHGSIVAVDYGAGQGARIDGVVAKQIAVEIESRVSKQIRGAVLDLICHRCPQKLLVILPVHADNPLLTANQCRNILSRFLGEQNFRVIVTKGNGDNECLGEDVALVIRALQDLGYNANA